MKELVFCDRYEVRDHFPFGYVVVFEENTILCWYLYKSYAERHCKQLNGAFNLGYNLGTIEGEISENKSR